MKKLGLVILFSVLTVSNAFAFGAGVGGTWSNKEYATGYINVALDSSKRSPRGSSHLFNMGYGFDKRAQKIAFDWSDYFAVIPFGEKASLKLGAGAYTKLLPRAIVSTRAFHLGAQFPIQFEYYITGGLATQLILSPRLGAAVNWDIYYDEDRDKRDVEFFSFSIQWSIPISLYIKYTL